MLCFVFLSVFSHDLMKSEKYIWDLIELLPKGIKTDYNYFRDGAYKLRHNTYYKHLNGKLYSTLVNNMELDVSMVVLCFFEGSYESDEWFSKYEPYGFHELFTVRGNANANVKCNLVNDTRVLISYLKDRVEMSKDSIESLVKAKATKEVSDESESESESESIPLKNENIYGKTALECLNQFVTDFKTNKETHIQA